MKKKRYRSNAAKGIWLVLVHVAAAVAVSSAALLIYVVIQGVNPLERADSYEKTAAFGNKIYEAAWPILRNIADVYTFSGAEDGSGDGIIDLKEIWEGTWEGGTLTGKNVSGLAYSAEDLKKWAQTSWEYGSTAGYDEGNNIVICEKVTGICDYDYYYYRDFIKLLDSGELSFDLEDMGIPDSGMESTEEETVKTIEEYLKYGQLEEGTLHMGVRVITDENGNEVYSEVRSYTGESIPEKFKPVNAESILDVLNTNPEWNGRIEEAFEALDRAIGMAADCERRAKNDEESYAEGKSNLTYYYVDEDSHQIYTNKRGYESYNKYNAAIGEMKSSGAYMILRPELSDCETNLAYLENERSAAMGARMAEWNQMAKEHSPAENYTFALNVDLTFPAEDSFAEAVRGYDRYSSWLLPLAAGCAGALLVMLVGFVWLTAAAGRRPGDEEIHLCFFDRWFTEIAAAAVFAAWIPGVMVLELGINEFNLREERALGIIGAVFGLYTVFWFSIGYLSLVRRIKAKLLWKGSLLHWLLSWVKKGFGKIRNFLKLYARNTGTKIKLTAGVGIFLLSQFFVNAIIFSGGVGFILLLFFADMALLAYCIRKAEGRERILEGLKRISDGELQYKIPVEGLTGEELTMAEYINNIGSGLDAAVESSMKNERMKTELITNVSHDIKTPLTSIINYVDLLKRENFTDPKICGYLDILEEKAQRLKVLTEDVVEASKASTGNISLQMTELDFVEMVHQVIGEFEEKFQEKQLTMMVHFADEPSVIYADGQHMWRVLENIFTNVTKYAMEGTRVYAEVKKNDCKVIFSLKNISAQPLNISADELTERFIRGDVSRNTEGSGLGLSIAKSLTELQGGEFRLYLDGDLFKVTITFAAK